METQHISNILFVRLQSLGILIIMLTSGKLSMIKLINMQIKKYNNQKIVQIRGVFRIQTNVHDGAF